MFARAAVESLQQAGQCRRRAAIPAVPSGPGAPAARTRERFVQERLARRTPSRPLAQRAFATGEQRARAADRVAIAPTADACGPVPPGAAARALERRRARRRRLAREAHLRAGEDA